MIHTTLTIPAPDCYTARMGTLYYGDRRSRFPFLDILTRCIADKSVDLAYLDPPFNSAQNSNAFFQEKDGTAEEAEGNREAGGRASHRRADCPAFARGCLRFAPAQAFEDTWEWNHDSRTAYDALSLRADKLGSVMRAFIEFLGPNDVMACPAMTAPRLVELREKLKLTGSLYLHCDPTA